jgi:hypothetical protein
MATKYKADYFLKDYSTIRMEMISRLPIISDGKLTDLNESSVSVTLVEVFAAIGDMLAFYLDSSALEAFLPTVRQPENVYRLTELIGYKIRETTSAKAMVQFTLATALTEEVFIPKGTRLGTSSGGGVSYRGQFLTLENTTIPIGDTISELINSVQGSTNQELFTGTGSATQTFTLNQGSIDLDTVEASSGSTAWDQVDTFLFSENDDYVFTAETSYSGVTTITFGDGKFGRVPSIGEQVQIEYIISSGKYGNVGFGAISLILSDIFTVDSNTPVESIVVTNPDPAAGGSDRQSLEQVKTNAPGSLAALYRPLTKYDYTALIARLGGIQHVNVWGEQEEDPPSYENMNWANICLVPTGGGLPSENLKYIVKDYLLTYQPITVRVRFIDPEYINVNVGMQVYVLPGYSQEEVRIKITDAVREFLNLENVRFGQDIYNSTFYKMAMSLDEVNHVYLDNLVTYDVETDIATDEGQEIILQKWQIPQLYAFSIEMHEAAELPVPDLYPDETRENEIWDFDG